MVIFESNDEMNTFKEVSELFVERNDLISSLIVFWNVDKLSCNFLFVSSCDFGILLFSLSIKESVFLFNSCVILSVFSLEAIPITNLVVSKKDLLYSCSFKEKLSLKRSDYTKLLISERLKAYRGNPSVRKIQMELTQRQHLTVKFERFKHVVIDEKNIDKYIFTLTHNKHNYQYVRVIIDKLQTDFIGKYENIQETQKRAYNFIQELIKWQCNQIAGNHP